MAVPAAQRPEFAPLLRLRPAPTNREGARLMEEAYGALTESRKLARGRATSLSDAAVALFVPFADRTLDVDKTIGNRLDLVDLLARRLRAQPPEARMSEAVWAGQDRPDGTRAPGVRDLFFDAMNWYSAVSEAREYQSQNLTKLVQDVSTNIRELPEQAARAAETGLKVGTVLLGAAALFGGLYVFSGAVGGRGR